MKELSKQPWINEIPEGAFVSTSVTYECGTHFDLFEQDEFFVGDDIIHKMNYYFYDPVQHGADPKGEYPVIVFLHGSGNSLVGKMCINYTGAEHFATEDYQKVFGGAYLLIPIANEYDDENGRPQGFWGPEYVKPVHDLIEHFIAKHTKGVDMKILLGSSSGATFAFEMVNHYMDYFRTVIPVGTSMIPSDEILDQYEEAGINLFYAYAQRDEFHSFEDEVKPRLARLQKMERCFIFTPEWVYNGDHGIASVNVGFEMGQHCLINAIHANLMFDDGTPMDERLPRGLTKWLDEVIMRG